MRQVLVLAALMLLPGQASIAGAQSTPTDQPTNQPQDQPTNQPKDRPYVLGPGDQIAVHVVDMEEIPATPLRIDPSGFIDLPLAGPVEAGGQTVDGLKAVLAAKLSRYINHPQISVNLLENQSRPVSVIGEVNQPGVHQLQGPRRLIEVISLAGGLRPDAGSEVILTRQQRWGALPLPNAKVDAKGGFSTASVETESLLGAKNPVENIAIFPDDVVSIPKADLVYVVGDVKKAGGFPLSAHNSISVLQALALSEGFGPSAAPGGAKIMRPAEAAGAGAKGEKVQEIPVNIGKMLAGKAPDVPLRANDILFVPNSLAKTSARRVTEAIIQTASGVAIYGR